MLGITLRLWKIILGKYCVGFPPDVWNRYQARPVYYGKYGTVRQGEEEKTLIKLGDGYNITQENKVWKNINVKHCCFLSLRCKKGLKLKSDKNRDRFSFIYLFSLRKTLSKI